MIPAALLALILVLIVSAERLHADLVALLDQSERMAAGHALQAALLVILFAAASAMFAFVSTGVIVPFVVYHWNAAAAVLLLWCGWMLGGLCAYSVGRYLGRPVVRALAPAHMLDRYEEQLSHRTPFGLVVLFQLALPSEVPGYLLGAARYAFPRYFLALAIAELPYALATVLLGASVVARRLPVVLGVGAAMLLLSVLAFERLHHHLPKQAVR